MELSAALKIIISLLIGAAIGLEREVHEREEDHPEHKKANPLRHIAFIGIRTLSLTTALGTIAGLLYFAHFPIFLTITISFLSLLAIHYIFSCWLTKDIGVTTEIAVIYSYMIGVLIAIEVFPIQLTLAIAVILMIILATKDQIKEAVDDVERRELLALISYGLIALVILPFLPNTALNIRDIPYINDIATTLNINLKQWGELELINPFKMWLIVAIVTGVDFAGYILERLIGKDKGLILTSLVGGFVSSTATTQSLAVQSKESAVVNSLLGAAMLATGISFIPIMIITAPINVNFFVRLLPTLIILMLLFFVAGFIFFRLVPEKRKNTKSIAKETDDVPFSLKPALIFASLYVGIKIITQIGLNLFGESGFLIASALAGFTGIDAATLNIADLARGDLAMFTAIFAFLLVNAVNLIAKTIYIFLQGTKEFAFKYGVTMAVIIAISFVGLLFV